jgi:hypothetical protein
MGIGRSSLSAPRLRLLPSAALAVVCACLLLCGLSPSGRAADAPRQAPALPPGAETCVDCHEIGPRSTTREAGTPPHLDAKGLLASPHAGVGCTDCHTDLAKAEFPHPEKLQKVDCGACHGDVKGMDRLTQAHEFNMGFCVQCHRDNKVSVECNICHR